MKSKISSKLKWLLISLLIVLTGFGILQRLEIFDSALLNMSFRYEDEKIKNIFSGQSISPDIKYLSYRNYQIRYLQLISNPELPFVIFIHGAPGSSADYHNFFKEENLTKAVNLISVDRLGYGYSSYGAIETTLEIQAEAVQAVIDAACGNSNVFPVGHSYGGPIALQTILSKPTNYQGVLLLAPAIDPEHEKEIKIAGLGIHPLTSWLATPAWRVASAEKLSHVSELKKLEPKVPEIGIPVYLIHGTHDSLVPYENVDYAQRKIDSDLFELTTLDGADHFLPWTHHDLIVKKILSITRNIKSKQD